MKNNIKIILLFLALYSFSCSGTKGLDAELNEGIIFRVQHGDIERTMYISVKDLGDSLVLDEKGWVFKNLISLNALNCYEGSNKKMLFNCCNQLNSDQPYNVEGKSVDSTDLALFKTSSSFDISKQLDKADLKLKFNNREISIKAVFAKSNNCNCLWPYEPSVMSAEEAEMAVFLKNVTEIRQLNRYEKDRMAILIGLSSEYSR